MFEIFGYLWGKNANAYKEYLKENKDVFLYSNINYTKLLTSVIDFVYNKEEDTYQKLDTKNITVIDNGEYQGTLLFIIPYDIYQPASYEYIYTKIHYGSCSGCDALQNALMYAEDNEEKSIDSIWKISLDLLANCKKLEESAFDERDKFIQMKWNV